MGLKTPITIWMVLLLAQGCGGDQDDLCQGVTCDDPPANTCKDANTLLEYPATGTCAANTGKCEYPPTEKHCQNGCSNGACPGNGDAFALEIPDDTKLCSLFASIRGSQDIFKDYAMKGLVTLKVGTVRLPRDQASFEADWFEKVEFGPDRAVLTPTGPGRFTRTIDGSAENGTYIYEYTRSYAAGGKTLVLAYRCGFVVRDGTPERDTITFDDEITSNALFDFEGKLLDGANQVDVRQYTRCGYPNYSSHFSVEMTMANGDTLDMNFRMIIGEVICKICPAALVYARFVSGAEEREVTDHFLLTYTADHHNWYQQFLVVFDSPVGNLHGIHVVETNYEAPQVTSVNYLDENLDTTQQVGVTSYKITQ